MFLQVGIKVHSHGSIPQYKSIVFWMLHKRVCVCGGGGACVCVCVCVCVRVCARASNTKYPLSNMSLWQSIF
jgi:hypothetical protein